jgi:transposase InsO family protein
MEFPVGKMCTVLEVSKSGYYKWLHRQPGKRALYNEHLTHEIKRVYHSSKRIYGSPRIAKELQLQGIKASTPLVARLMKKENIRSIIRKRFKQTTDSKHHYPVAENKLMRQFTVKEKNEVWVSDLTYIHTRQGWLYLTTVIDLFDRKVIGWALSNNMYTHNTSVAAFKMALINRPIRPEKQLIFHSDRGVQYACNDFTSILTKHPNILQSMSRKGNCWDNAVAESFFKTLKAELVYHHKYETINQAELSVFEYIETFYNTTRRHKHLGNLTILEYQKLINLNNLNNAPMA